MTTMSAKGSVVRSTLKFLHETAGADAVARVLDLLPPATRARCERADPTEELPYEIVKALWQAADEVVGAGDPEWMQRAGAFSIESTGVELYAGILRKSSPSEFLTQSISLFRLFYHPGNMEVVAQEDGHAVLRLVGFPGDPVFCRRQTGGLLRSVELAGGANPSVRHVRCAVEGDAFCEWELRWEPPQG